MQNATPQRGTATRNAEARLAASSVEALNAHYREFPVDCSIHERIEWQAQRSPQAVAVTLGDTRMTYAELDQRANQLARRIQSLGVAPDSFVAVCMERSFEMIVSLLAILKAGGAYLPLDPSYPKERLQIILEDAKPALVLMQAHLSASIEAASAQIVYVDNEWPRLATESSALLASVTSPQNLAYVIYTSGSTGKPKGVMVTHANVLRLMSATEEWFHFQNSDVWTFFHSFAFDFSVWEIWGCLMTGGRLVVVPYWLARTPASFYRLLSEQGVTVLNQTPAAFYQLIQVEESGETLPLNLRFVIFGGEALNFSNLKPWFERHGDEQPQLVNMYGITETTVHVTYRLLSANDGHEERRSLIGEPIPDLRLYLLNDQLEPVPAGEVGELFVGGAGVAKGYLNRPDLNAQRFVPDPFASCPGALMYRSGDLARFCEDGELEYLGRGDTQVKIHGFRIELGEIEAALVQHPKIHQAVVQTFQPEVGEKKLAAYYVPNSAAPIENAELCHFLQTKLPSHMIPFTYVSLEALPLTVNGKIDRSKLPTPQRTSANTAAHVTPRSAEETLITSIVGEVLRLDSVSSTDNFFDLGGDSLLLVAIHSRLQKALLREIPVTDLFDFPSATALAAHLSGKLPSSSDFQAARSIAQKQREAFSRLHLKKGGA